jgi:hypothetical protein
MNDIVGSNNHFKPEGRLQVGESIPFFQTSGAFWATTAKIATMAPHTLPHVWRGKFLKHLDEQLRWYPYVDDGK